MKIAVVTDDRETIAMHFGRARYYRVFEIADGRIVGEELIDRRETLHHGHDHDHDHGRHHGGGHHHDHGHHHGGGHHDHSAMVAQLGGAEAIIAGGMGYGAYHAMQAADVAVYVTDGGSIDDAIARYLAGELPQNVDRVH